MRTGKRQSSAHVWTPSDWEGKWQQSELSWRQKDCCRRCGQKIAQKSPYPSSTEKRSFRRAGACWRGPRETSCHGFCMQNVILPAAGGWFVVSTHPHREDFASENLERQDFNVYCPRIVKHIRHARRAYDARRPLFPGYLFVERETTLCRWRPILGTFGVRSVVRQGDAPSLLPGSFVQSLRAREVDGVIQRPEAPFQTGQQAAIRGGPFDGVIGRIIELRDNDRVLLLLDLLSQKTKMHVDVKRLRSV